MRKSKFAEAINVMNSQISDMGTRYTEAQKRGVIPMGYDNFPEAIKQLADAIEILEKQG